MDGLLLIDKEPGFTSHDVVAIARRQIMIKKIGHTGTLDPAATGLLVLCVGGATRLQHYLMGMDKMYAGTIRFGWATDTYDGQGKPSGEPLPRNVEEIDFGPHLEQFRGEFDQMPPAYSAKKVHGVRAYELARKGQVPDLEARKVLVSELEVDRVEGENLRFHIRCSSGTYVRSIAHDLGEAVGVPAHLSELRRTTIGDFSVDLALGTAALKSMERDAILDSPHFIPMKDVRLPLATVLVDPSQEKKLVNGQTIIVKTELESLAKDALVTIVTLSDEFVAIAVVSDVIGKEGGPVVLKPKVVLKRE